MRMVTIFLIPALLIGCSKEPVAWEDKTPEQQKKESQYWRHCYAKHYKTKDTDVCDSEFEKEFGYPYKRSSTQKK